MKSKLLMAQDIVFWSMILKMRKAESKRGTEKQTVVPYFSGDDFLGSISFEEVT